VTQLVSQRHVNFGGKVLECEHEIASSSCVWELAVSLKLTLLFLLLFAFRFSKMAKPDANSLTHRNHMARFKVFKVVAQLYRSTSFLSISLIIIARDYAFMLSCHILLWLFALAVSKHNKRRETPPVSGVTLTRAWSHLCVVIAMVHASVSSLDAVAFCGFFHELRDQQDSHHASTKNNPHA
jgi:hypothetical protein